MTVATPVPLGIPQQASLETELTTRTMGGGLRLLVASGLRDDAEAERDLRRVADRIDAWAGRLTRFRDDSDLAQLNADPGRLDVALRPTLAAALTHARAMSAATAGVVDVSLLDARLAAETGGHPSFQRVTSWSLTGDGRDRRLAREVPVRFDLDGVAKGWIADRALLLLDAYPAALVDADGDIAVRTAGPTDWQIGVPHPQEPGVELARLHPPADWPGGRFGIATSGTSVHRWQTTRGVTHHLIDPWTGQPAETDVVQATVVAERAGLAEALAKAAVIRGAQAGPEVLAAGGAWAALLLLVNGDLLVLPGSDRWLD